MHANQVWQKNTNAYGNWEIFFLDASAKHLSMFDVPKNNNIRKTAEQAVSRRERRHSRRFTG